MWTKASTFLKNHLSSRMNWRMDMASPMKEKPTLSGIYYAKTPEIVTPNILPRFRFGCTWPQMVVASTGSWSPACGIARVRTSGVIYRKDENWLINIPKIYQHCEIKFTIHTLARI